MPTLKLSVSDDLHNKLKLESKKDGMSMSQKVELILEAYYGSDQCRDALFGFDLLRQKYKEWGL